MDRYYHSAIDLLVYLQVFVAASCSALSSCLTPNACQQQICHAHLNPQSEVIVTRKQLQWQLKFCSGVYMVYPASRCMLTAVLAACQLQCSALLVLLVTVNMQSRCNSSTQGR